MPKILSKRNDIMIERFLDYLRYEKGAAQKTVEEYGSDLQMFRLFYKSMDKDLE